MSRLINLSIVLFITLFSCNEYNQGSTNNNDSPIDSLAYHNYTKGNELVYKYDFENGIPYLLKSAEVFETTKDYNMQAKALISISLAYHDFGKYDKGLEYAELAKSVLDEHPNKTDKKYYWYVYNNAGINYDDNKQPQKAIEEHLKALPYASNASDSSYTYNNLGNSYKKLNQYDLSEKYFKLSLQCTHDKSDYYHNATLHSNMVDIERLKKNYALAQKHLDSATHFANLSKSPEKLLDIYYYSYQLKTELSDFSSANDYLNKYVKLKDSLFTSDKNEIVLQYQTKYETEKKEKEITEQKLISKQKNIWLILLASVILIGFVFIRNYILKSKLKQKQLSLEFQLLQEQTHSKIQEERLKISRELHDNIGAQLTFIQSISDSLKSSRENIDKTLSNKIDTISDFTEHSINELKNTIWVLNTEELDLNELKLRMLNFMSHAADARDDIKFHFNFELKENFRLSSKQAINLFRVFQEILNNTLKYAKAQDVYIDVTQNKNNINLKVVDNGIGFDFENEKNKSFGLTNIQNRINEINGILNINTSLGNGTQYEIKVIVS